MGAHHTMEEFAVRGKEPKDEVQIYTWKDATLRELTDLVKEVAPAARRRNARLSFAFVFPDKNGRFKVQEVIFSIFLIYCFSFMEFVIYVLTFMIIEAQT